MQNFTESITLLKEGPLPLGHHNYDKIFLLARHNVLSPEDGVYRFVIEDGTPTVRLNDKVEANVPTVKEIAASQDYSLFSANVMLKIAGYGYPVLKRDAGAPVYPGHYTCSAGRCEQSPWLTAVAELNQEIAVFVRNKTTGEIRLLGYEDTAAAEAGKAHKEKGMRKSLPEVLVVPLSREDGPDRYEFMSGAYGEKGLATIVYDKATNAYEVCFTATTELPAGWEVAGIDDGDGFSREASFIAQLNDLVGQPCVPALAAFIKRSGSH